MVLVRGGGEGKGITTTGIGWFGSQGMGLSPTRGDCSRIWDVEGGSIDEGRKSRGGGWCSPTETEGSPTRGGLHSVKGCSRGYSCGCG